MTTHVLTLTGPEAPVTLIADALMDDPRFQADASGAFDQGDGSWALEAYFPALPDLAELADRLGEMLEDQGVAEDEAAALLAGLVARPLDMSIWASTGLDQLPPIVAGRFRVFGEHNRPTTLRRHDVMIEASRAFGSGDHASTYLSLAQLDHVLKYASPRNVLDVGTGTGILGLALRKALPFATVLASDIDAHSVQRAEMNSRINGITSGFRVLHADGLKRRDFGLTAPFDLVLANILPDPLAGVAADIARLTAPGGHLIMAGLRRGEAARLVSAYAARGFTLRRRIFAKEWASLLFKNTGRRPLWPGMKG